MDFIAVAIGQALVPLLFSTVITTILKKTGFINHYFRLKLFIAYVFLCVSGNILVGMENWRYIMTILNGVLFISAVISVIFYVFSLIRFHR